MENGLDLENWTAVGRILVRRGVLTPRQLERALEEQQKRRTSPLGELLVELRLCAAEEVEEALAEQALYRLPPETHHATLTAQETLRAAFAKVEAEAGRLEKRRTESGVLALAISPGDDDE